MNNYKKLTLSSSSESLESNDSAQIPAAVLAPKLTADEAETEDRVTVAGTCRVEMTAVDEEVLPAIRASSLAIFEGND